MILAKVNKPITEQTPVELRLSTVCVSIIADMLEINQILEHQLTHSIMVKKYAKLFNSMDAQLSNHSPAASKYFDSLMREYFRYLSSSRIELDELEIEDKLYDISRMYV